MDKVLRYFGIARKAGFLELGEENTGVAVRGGKAKAVFLASDASDNAQRRAEGFVYGRSVPLLHVSYTKEAISQATGKGGCSMAAVTDIGLASTIVSALAEAEPERFAEAETVLAARRDKAKKRKAAAAQQQNKKTGKRRTGI